MSANRLREFIERILPRLKVFFVLITQAAPRCLASLVGGVAEP